MSRVKLAMWANRSLAVSAGLALALLIAAGRLSDVIAGTHVQGAASYGMPEFYNRMIHWCQLLALKPWIKVAPATRVIDQVMRKEIMDQAFLDIMM